MRYDWYCAYDNPEVSARYHQNAHVPLLCPTRSPIQMDALLGWAPRPGDVEDEEEASVNSLHGPGSSVRSSHSQRSKQSMRSMRSLRSLRSLRSGGRLSGGDRSANGQGRWGSGIQAGLRRGFSDSLSPVLHQRDSNDL